MIAMHQLEDYLAVVDAEVITDIFAKARNLYGKHVLHLNSTFQGGGVAEMLSTLVPLINDASVDAGWRVLHGNDDFYGITKQLHNALQGGEILLSEEMKRFYLDTNWAFSVYTHIDHDAIVVHDPQPLPLIRYYSKNQPWIWRCHLDLTEPNPELWEYLKPYILRYDKVIISSEKYRRPDLPVEQRIIPPAINPLSPKNKEYDGERIAQILEQFRIPVDKPFMTQISRFDQWKDPLGVAEVFRKVREEVDCRLILCGSMASDDPEGYNIYEDVRSQYADLIEHGDLLLVTYQSDILVNALQTASAVVIQKSLREGFGLTVTEAMWKKKPVVASNVGGISLQIDDGENGFLLEPYDIDGFAEHIVSLINNEDLAREIGLRAREKVRREFLITRLLRDYLDLFNDLIGS